MNFARYWSSIEVRVPARFGKPGAVRVWGASNSDEAAALSAARARAANALAFFAGQTKDYEYDADVIREELVEEFLDDSGERLAVITRNRYGALVLNTERVLFGDIDLPSENFVLRLCNRFGRRARDKQYFLDAMRAFQTAHPQFVLQVYETRAGLRFMVVNCEIRPDGAEVDLLFKELPVDRLYTRLCRSQLCFRARLTPKPWRIGLPRPSARFPFSTPLKQRSFNFWLAQYVAKSRNACAARRLERFGDGVVPAAVQTVLDIHDRYACDEDSSLA
ncbi:MAG: hypothetical protein IT492_03775 [Gammaproteobacteria bacterium]|nr:hypothetical protein [Gammaproteobacteria bacterium]